MKLLDELKLWSEYLLSPPYCAYCHILLSSRIPLCAICRAAIRPVVSTDLSLTPSKTISVRALGRYEDPLKRMLAAKQKRILVAAQQVGSLLADHLAESICTADVLVPVPLHWRRHAWRGYNQAEVIADMIGKRLAIPVLPLVLRTLHTPPQAEQQAHERWDNVENAFMWNAAYAMQQFAHKRIILVDDIMTTGSTLKATARALLPVQGLHLEAVVVARVQ